jgi:nucleotide-binding universal stress UspA family protein
MVVLFTGHDDPQISDCGLDLAAERNGKLLALYIIDTQVADAVFDKLTDLVFVGERPSSQLANAILEEYTNRARECLEEVAKAAARRGVECETRLERGQALEHVMNVAHGHAAREILLAEPERSFFLQFVSPSLAHSVRRAGFNVHVVRAGGERQPPGSRERPVN